LEQQRDVVEIVAELQQVLCVKGLKRRALSDS
jgi:hypothetical protein